MVEATAALKVQGLAKTYGQFHMQDVSFELNFGRIMGFVGRNGAGKTTTIKMILGIVFPQAGSIELFGKPYSPDVVGKIGVVMDSPYYSGEWKLTEVESACKHVYDNWDSAAFYAHLNEFGLDKNKKVKELSRGMSVKLQIAAALSHDAQLLIMDEPTSGIDPLARDDIGEMLEDFVSDGNHAVFYSTHITTDLEKTADDITFIRDGEILYTGTKAELLTKYMTVEGEAAQVSEQLKAQLVGWHEHAGRFDALIAREALDYQQLPDSCTSHPASLDDIVVSFSRATRKTTAPTASLAVSLAASSATPSTLSPEK